MDAENGYNAYCELGCCRALRIGRYYILKRENFQTTQQHPWIRKCFGWKLSTQKLMVSKNNFNTTSLYFLRRLENDLGRYYCKKCSCLFLLNNDFLYFFILVMLDAALVDETTWSFHMHMTSHFFCNISLETESWASGKNIPLGHTFGRSKIEYIRMNPIIHT